MRTNGTDDGPTIEEILASIRRLVADAARDPSSAPPPDLPNFAALAEELDPDGSFELPALYRGALRGSESNQRPPPNDGQSGDDVPDVVQRPAVDLNTSGGREEQQAKPPIPEPWFEALCAAARALETMQSNVVGQEGTSSPSALDADGGMPDQQVPASSPALPDAQTADISVPRTMSPCKDTVISRMGRVQREPDKLTPAAVEPEKPDFAAETPLLTHEAASQKSHATSPDQSMDALLSGRVGESAAEAIRPLVREWLDSNMRLILEQALRDELKSTKGGNEKD